MSGGKQRTRPVAQDRPIKELLPYYPGYVQHGTLADEGAASMRGAVSMKVTSEMVDRAASMLADFKHPTGKRAVRNALEHALADVPELNVCEVCKLCLVPQAPRCEKHAHTEPGDEEWERDFEP